MQHYDFPIYHAPSGLETHINTFYQAKYGMFTCHDTALNSNIGRARYDEALIQYWQRNEQSQLDTWYLAIAYALSSSKKTLADYKDFKKNYRESKSYESYLSRHPGHLSDLQDQIMRI